MKSKTTDINRRMKMQKVAAERNSIYEKDFFCCGAGTLLRTFRPATLNTNASPADLTDNYVGTFSACPQQATVCTDGKSEMMAPGLTETSKKG
jgi:hypothetical protein